MSVSPQAVSMRDYDACFVNLQSWSELFTAPPNSQLCTEPVSTQRQREYTLCECLNASALPLAGAIRETPGEAVEG